MQVYQPRPYQQLAQSWLASRPKAALFLDVGLGKSVVALLDMVTSLAMGDTKRWLVVAPLRVCQTTWPSELDKWTFAQHLRVCYLHGGLGKAERMRRSDEALDYDVTIINVENLTKLIRHHGSHWPYDGVILDESSKFKDKTTQRWKAMSHVVRKVNYLRELTGSPCAQTLMNLWPQVYLLDHGQRLGARIEAFKFSYFRQVDYMGYDWEPIDGALGRILERIKDICLVIHAIGMPEPVYNTIRVNLPPKALVSYLKLEREMFLEVKDDQGITAISAATLTNKLTQLANGFAYWDDDDQVGHVHDLHTAKVEAVEEFADEQGGPFLLGYHYKEDKQRLANHFGKRLEFFDGSRDQMNRWGAGDFQILAMHPQSGGHGVDGLQHHSCTVLWYSPPWSREQFDQMNGRVTGARQKGTKFEKQQAVVNILMATKTIDESAEHVLFERGDTQRNFLNELEKRGRELLAKLPG